MTDEKSQEQLQTQHFEQQVRERVQALRSAFTPLTRLLKPSDEPAAVFRPDIYPDHLL